MKKVNIIVLSGFLGSGKTTLLKDLVQYERSKNRRIGVLMNELGDVGIDSAIIPKDTPFVEMLNGCICCTMQGELSVQLNLLVEEHQLDIIYIEATGAAHPLEILEACTHPILANKLSIKGIVTVVNAKQWSENKLSNRLKKLLTMQVKYADIVLINKKDQVTSSILHSIKEDVELINQRARILMTTFAEMDLSCLYNEKKESMDLKDKGISNNESHVHNHLHLSTFTCPIPEPIDRLELLDWLEKMQGNVYRVKGFIHLNESPGLFLFNYAQGDPIIERYRSEKNYSPVLVFIGEGIDQTEVEKGINKLQDKASTPKKATLN
ncbi:CobW family GTP-binding protein [Salipaludibacillus sp. HK11]|uniref:CobW family GTP-binding protein n=1 Tax=Salipaludibacillus sp. HK11 TaxID=3394320 RepID=UPI0039FCAC4C